MTLCATHRVVRDPDMHLPALPSSSCGDDAASPLLLKRGERFLAPDVYRTCLDGREAVIKDYSR